MAGAAAPVCDATIIVVRAYSCGYSGAGQGWDGDVVRSQQPGEIGLIKRRVIGGSRR